MNSAIEEVPPPAAREKQSVSISRIAIRAVYLLMFLIVLQSASSELQASLSNQIYLDFNGYYTAACLVKSHHNLEIYEQARLGLDPVTQDATPGSTFAKTAKAHGFVWAGTYDYPPTLADMFVPLTALSPLAALTLWRLFSVAALLSAGVILARLLGITSLAQTTLVTILLLLFRPSMDCLREGQVSILLLFFSPQDSAGISTVTTTAQDSSSRLPQPSSSRH